MKRFILIALVAVGCEGGGDLTSEERALLQKLVLEPLPSDPTNAVADDERAAGGGPGAAAVF
jgi:hypothetical protein